MNGFRVWMGDRVAGAATAALAGWFVALQLFLAAFGCGIAVAGTIGGDPLLVLCEPGTANNVASHDAERGHECPSGVCQTHLPDPDLGAALLAGSLRVDFPEDPSKADSFSQRILPLSRGADGLPPAPRGPPPISS